MISLEQHTALMAKWPGRVYATPERVRPRLAHLEPLLQLFEGGDILEIGANAGLHAEAVMHVCDGYTGIEPDPDYRKQFFITNPESRAVLHSELASIKDDARRPEGLLCCVALYLLSQKELALLAEKFMPDIWTVIIQERLAHRDKPGNHTNGLHTHKSISRWLEGFGLETQVYYDAKGKLFEVVGQR
jgi:hypothetical protein